MEMLSIDSLSIEVESSFKDLPNVIYFRLVKDLLVSNTLIAGTLARVSKSFHKLVSQVGFSMKALGLAW